MTLDHHLAAHGPTGTTYGPPGLVFTPNRYSGLNPFPAPVISNLVQALPSGLSGLV